MSADSLYLHVAVPAPLRRHFDYLLPAHTQAAKCLPGCRVRVPFGNKKYIGIILECDTHTDQPRNKLKRADALLDETPVLSSELLSLLRFASTYYQHPIGDVVHSALPTLLRQGRAAQHEPAPHWRVTAEGKVAQPASKRAVKQAALLQYLQAMTTPISDEQLKSQFEDCAGVLKRLQELGWIESVYITDASASSMAPRYDANHVLNDEQQSAFDHIHAARAQFAVFVLDGVTGSGKTEVYLQLIQHAIAQGKQILVLVPEIGLTPQLVQRFHSRLCVPIGLWHSNLTEVERLHTWIAAREGTTQVFIGTRSAVFLPLQHPGLIIIDEEHDASFKQQEGFRYSARDLAIVRARHWQTPIVLGSATPSLESLANVERQRYQRLVLSQRAGAAQTPRLHVLDVRKQAMEQGLSYALRQHMQHHLARDGQVLVFLNRRGFAPTLLCHDCGWIAKCLRCDSHMTLHHAENLLRCHHCGAQRPRDPACPACKSEQLVDVGVGTERIESALRKLFPDIDIVRIDRDTTRRKGSLDTLLKKVEHGTRQILIGTQMLAKGHHFPNVTLVAVVDTDQGLHSAEFRATERMAQLILQVSGRAGRAERPGEVIIQTHHPDHPLLQILVTHGYHEFARAALREREQAQLPPYTNMAILRAESVTPQAGLNFLQTVREKLQGKISADLQCYGPLPAPMNKRAGRYRAQLILNAQQRKSLHDTLTWLLPLIETGIPARQVRWSIDVDPIDTY